MLSVLDGELDKLTGRGRAQLSRIVLLLQEASLAVDTETGGGSLLLPVNVVTAAAEEDQQATISQSTNTN